MEEKEVNKNYILHAMGMESSKYGGIERFNVALSEALLEKGYHSIFVYESEPVCQEFVTDLKETGALVFVSNSRKHPVRFCVDFVRLLRQYHPLLVHAHFTKARFYAIPIAYWMGVKRLFFTIHSRMDPKKQIKPLTRFWYGRANRIAKVIAVSEDIASVYRKNWSDAEVRQIYLGVKPIIGDRFENRRKLGIPQDQLMLLTIANFNHIKGLDVLCKAIELLKRQGKWDEKARLYIVGQPEADRQTLGELMETLQIHDEVKMVGISNEVPDYLTSADIYVQPSRSEGLPLALMEATASSLPVVATRVGGIPEIVKEGRNGVLVESENEDALAEAMIGLMNNPKLRNEYGKCSKQIYNDKFSVEAGVSKTMMFYGLN